MAFAQIDQYFIERFHLLTRNEIIVYCYLVRKRNDETGRCDPKQKTIAAETGLAVSRVSEAVKGLSEKGWAFSDENGNYLLPEKVTDSVRKVTENVSEKVTENVTLVTTSVRKSYGKRNSHIKELKRQVKDKNNTSALTRKGSRIPDDFYPSDEMIIFARQMLPDDNIEHRILEFKNYWFNATKGAIKKDWNKTFQNRILQILEWKEKHKQNGTNKPNTNGGYKPKRTDADVFEESADWYAQWNETGVMPSIT